MYSLKGMEMTIAPSVPHLLSPNYDNGIISAEE